MINYKNCEWSNEKESKFQEYYYSNVPLREIAKKLQVSRSYIENRFKSQEPKRKIFNYWTEDEINILKFNLNEHMDKLRVLLPNRDVCTIWHKAIHLGRNRGNNGNLKLTEETKQRIIEIYSTLKEVKKTAEIVGNISEESIRQFLLSIGIKPKDRRYSRSCRKDLQLNYSENFPASEELLGYVCGIIATDGCLLKGTKSIVLELQIGDRDFVDSLASLLTIGGPKLSTTKRKT